MKKFFLTLVTAILFCIQGMQAQATSIGHRDGMTPVLDLSRESVLNVVRPELEAKGFSNVRIASMEISDRPGDPEYYKSVAFKILADDGKIRDLSIAFLYPIAYDAEKNAYHFLDYRDLKVKNGGPDKNYCVAVNCSGCESQRDSRGKLTGCSPCFPTDPSASYSCSVSNTAGTGGARILGALSGIFEGLIKLL